MLVMVKLVRCSIAFVGIHPVQCIQNNRHRLCRLGKTKQKPEL